MAYQRTKSALLTVHVAPNPNEEEWDEMAKQNKCWKEKAYQERERQRKQREEQEREWQKEKEKHLEIQKQTELEQQKKRETDIQQKEDMERQSAQEEVSPEQRQEKDRAKMVLKTQIQSIEKPTRVTGQRLVCQTDEIKKVRNNLLRKTSKACHSTIQATCHRKPGVIHVKSFIQNDTDQRPNPAESLPDTEPTSTTDDLKPIHQVIDSKLDENNTMIPSKEGPRGDPNFCQVLDIELDDDDSGITPLTGSVIPKSEVESCCKSDSDESVYEKTKRLEIEKLKKGNVAFMPLEKEDEHQGTTKQQLPQDSVYPFKAHSYDPDVRREGGGDEEEMNASPCLEDTYSQKELPDATEHNETGMEGEGEKKDKSVRRRLFRWVNDKAKNYYNNKIDRTIRREEEEGKSTYQPWYMAFPMPRAQREQEKRRALLKAEDRRQRMEESWQKREAKRAVKKEKKKIEKQEWERDWKEAIALYYGFPGATLPVPVCQ